MGTSPWNRGPCWGFSRHCYRFKLPSRQSLTRFVVWLCRYDEIDHNRKMNRRYFYGGALRYHFRKLRLSTQTILCGVIELLMLEALIGNNTVDIKVQLRTSAKCPTCLRLSTIPCIEVTTFERSENTGKKNYYLPVEALARTRLLGRQTEVDRHSLVEPFLQRTPIKQIGTVYYVFISARYWGETLFKGCASEEECQ